jgi:hypothetical protein
VALYDLSANRKPHPDSLIWAASPVEPLEGKKDFVQVFLLKPDAVVLHIDFKDISHVLCMNLHTGSLAITLEFQRVSDQVLKKLTHLNPVRARNIYASLSNTASFRRDYGIHSIVD